MKVVIISGYFNPLHSGHLKLIKESKKLGDKLIVIVNNDIQQMRKKHTIIMKEKERLEIVNAIKYVDESILAIDNDATIIETLEFLAKKYAGIEIIFANGGDDRLTESSIPEAYICRKYNIKTVFGVGGEEKINSSTNINTSRNEELIYKTVLKSWGYEKWIINIPLYCSKILHVNKDHCCSFHYHKIKDETFYILSGCIKMELSSGTITLFKDDVIRLKPGTLHRFFGLEESNIIETSTQHFDDDSIRLTKTDNCNDMKI